MILFNNNFLSAEIIEGNTKIIDGDTLHIGKYKIRLHGIDAPELNQNCNFENKDWNCGQKSRNFLLNTINSNSVNCKVTDIDQYKRYVAICFSGKLNLNEIIVKNGWAIAYRYYSKDYVEEELYAKTKKIGIWKGSFEEPYIYRKKNKE